MKGSDRRISGWLTSDPELWKRLWLEAKERSPVNRRERRSRKAELDHWNSRARSYSEHSESEKSRGRREQVVGWLEEKGALQRGFRVLDIGAGPGTFAIPISGRVAEVAALEPAERMVSILKRKIKDAGIDNVRVFQKPWEHADLSAEGWTEAFDLVFASMCPGVGNPDMLEKMIRASKAFCYLSGWSGARWGRWAVAQSELWPLIFGEELGDYPSDILYAFGFLYALGYRPELRFRRPRVSLEMASGQAVEGLVHHFSRYVDVGPDVRETIRSYVQSNSRGGTFTQDGITCQGFMLWSVARH
jgi:SAM-dependent methyltransferase